MPRAGRQHGDQKGMRELRWGFPKGSAGPSCVRVVKEHQQGTEWGVMKSTDSEPEAGCDSRSAMCQL